MLSFFLFAFRSHFFNIPDPFLYIGWWSFVLAIVVNVVVRYFTKPEPDEKLRGLVYGMVTKKE